MKDQLPKYKPKTLKASHNATSSQESEAGLSHSSSRASRQQPDSGRDRPHASRSALPENSSGNTTPDTLRPSSSTSSASAALQSCLGNKLRQQLQNRGCAIYKLTWREKATPSGLPYSQLVASVPRTKETDCSSVPWATPHTSASTGAGTQGRAGGMNIQTMSALAVWPTPTASNNDRTPAPERAMEMYRENGSKIQQRLQDFAAITQPTRITASGQMLTGSDAGMESSGQLNPAHSRWLMGFPLEWDACAVTAMQSSRKSPPNSSKHSWRPKPKLGFKVS